MFDSSDRGFPLVGFALALLQVLFVGLKLTGYIAWSWLVVLWPLWAWLGLIGILALITLIVVLFLD